MTKVVMYTLSTCPWCRKAKKFFSEYNIPFECIDYDLADDAQQERILADMRKYGADLTFPFVKIGDNTVSGYNPDRYSRLLGIR